MRTRVSLLVLCAVLGASAACAQTGPVIAYSSRPDVPVIINGLVVNGDVVYGDWGLARPGHGQIIIEGPVGYSLNYDSRGYFPATGTRPRVGRLEIEPAHRPRGDTTYYREWGAASDTRAPVTQSPPFDPPPVILAPRSKGQGHR